MRGLPRRYVAREDNPQLLRGKLHVTRQVTHLAARPDRLLKAAVSRLRRAVRTEANARLLAKLAARFEAVGDSPHPLREPVRFDRTNAAFRALHSEWQSTAGGDVPGFALLFPMNKLFERFVGKSLRRALAPRSVRLHPADHHALTDANGRRLFALRPDVTIEVPEGPIVLDTKWKRLSPGEETLDVAPSDVYQMLAYARVFRASRLILLYPWTRGLPPEGRARQWMVAGSVLPLKVATLDVGRPDAAADTLRRIVGAARETALPSPTSDRAAA